MPLEVLDKTPWQRLRKRFNLGDYGLPVNARMSETIVPVTNMDELVGIAGQVQVSKNLVAAAGTYVPFMVVPVGKRREIIHVWREATVAISYVQVSVKESDSPAFWRDQATAAEVFDTPGLVIAEGGSIGMTTTGNAGDGAVDMAIFYREEEAY